MGKPSDDALTGITRKFNETDGETLQLQGLTGSLFEAGHLTWINEPSEFNEIHSQPDEACITNRLSTIRWKSWHVSPAQKSRKPGKKTGVGTPELHDYLPLVRLIAQKIHRPLPASVILNDLVQDGMIGLMTAFSEHDESLGVPFRVFAENKIRWAIMDGLRAGDWAGRSVRRRATKVAKTTAKLQALLNREPSKQEIADALEVPIDSITSTLGDAHGYSFVRIDDAPNGEPLDIPDSRMEPHPIVEQREVYSLAVAGLRTLRPNERQALILRTLCDMSVQQAAAEMEISESRVSQLCKKATEKLARYMD